MSRMTRLGFLTLLVPLFGFAVWLRVTSLEALPDPDADEAWFTTQFALILQGKSFESRTSTANPLTPFQALIQVPLLMVFGPTLWITRAASAVAGILAVILTYVLGSRILDRVTALIASALLAVLPFAILQSRTGYDSSQAPLYSILLIYCAFRTSTIGTVVMLALAYLVHPTNVFITPLVLAVFLARSLRRARDESVAVRWRPLLLKLTAIGAAALSLGLLTLMRPLTQSIFNNYHVGPTGQHDLFHFWTLYGRLLLASGRESRLLLDWLFWLVVLVTMAYGTERLVLERRWDRLALVAGVVLSALALFLMGGSDIIQPGMVRWGLFLLVPSVLAFACLVRSLLVAPTGGGWRAVGYRAQVAVLLLLGWGLLFSCPLGRVNFARVLDGVALDDPPQQFKSGSRTRSILASGPGDGDAESVWTFQTDVKDPKKQALSLIRRDLRASAGTGQDARGAGVPEVEAKKAVIIAQDLWLYGPLKYLALAYPQIEVFSLEKLVIDKQGNYLGDLFEDIRAGAYFVGYPGNDVEKILNGQFSPESFRSWVIRRFGVEYIAVRRLKKVHEKSTEPLQVAPSTAARPLDGAEPSVAR